MNGKKNLLTGKKAPKPINNQLAILAEFIHLKPLNRFGAESNQPEMKIGKGNARVVCLV